MPRAVERMTMASISLIRRLSAGPAPRRLIYNLGVEHAFTCPYCWQRISMVLDPSVESQTYVEDCEICCKPIEVQCTIEDGILVEFDARIL